ncbi:MAG TPA: DNA replication and repair protein RecF [Gaiellaceae bacterium]|nr:DNA replication and repair protein RecF [Gaiellaceae bacterium]
MICDRVTLRQYRSYPSLDLDLAPGLVLVVGRNGVGKTNLLEALHVATQGFSPRTRHDAQLVRFGESAARVAVAGRRGSSPVEVSLTLREGQAKEARLNGARLPSAESLRREFSTLVFTPDRLAVVKGGPAARRAYFDRTIGRLFPARAAVPQDYAAALAQRNAALRRVQLGLSDRAALEPWTERIAALGAALVATRRETLERLAPSFAERAGELGLAEARLGYDADPPTAEALAARLQRDVERGATGLGPHLDDVTISSGDRDLRQFGSQGEQRLAVLSLLLAEAELLDTPPLLLLDDVLSELDPGRRRVLAERVATMGQTMITATHASALPVEPAQIVEVEPGTART